MKSFFDFVKFFGWYWNFYKINLRMFLLERDVVEFVGEIFVEDYVKIEEIEMFIENYEVIFFFLILYKKCNKILLLKYNKI